MTTLSAEDVRSLPYVQLLARMGESNRPPGGMDTVRRMVINCHLRPDQLVLHAGCNAGFLSRELARRSGCKVVGVDISPEMAEAASQRAHQEGVEHLVRHECQDMRALSFADESFDVVLSGGALAFVDGHEQAIREWIRVARPFGILAEAELYYRQVPPESLRERVSEAIGVEIPIYDALYWPSIFEHVMLEPYYRRESQVVTRSDEEVASYCEDMVQFAAAEWSAPAREALYDRLLELFQLFNENLKYMNQILLVYRRLAEGAEPALFV